MSIITLTTDFGLADSYVGAMKGVILTIAPQAHIVDISHHIPPQDVRRAAYVLQSAAPFFPPGAIHVVVVDPGVGSQRRPIALQAGAARYVGPDNGVFSYALAARGAQMPASVVHLDNPAYWLPAVSRTFHGRDIFAPVAAHLAAGAPLSALGSAIDDPVTFAPAQPQRRPGGAIRGQIVYSDHFGNLVSNVPAAWLAGQQWRIQIAGRQLIGPQTTYAAVQPGQLLALIGSAGALEVAVRQGSAAQRLGVGVGEPIDAIPREMDE